MPEVRAGWAVATHDLLWVDGPEAVSFLDGQISQDVAAMAPGAVARSFLLGPRGKLRALLWVLRDEHRVGLLTSAGTGDAVRADLDRYRFRVQATIAPDERSVASRWGVPVVPGWEQPAGVTTVRLPTTAPSQVVVGDGPGEPLLSVDEVAAHRILAGEPVFGIDVDEGTIPQETGLVPASVSFDKGCYLGQELVARIDSRGHVNRMLRRVEFPAPVPPGTAVMAGGAEVGRLGTVAPVGTVWHALAVLRREAAPGCAVVAAGVPGVVATDPGP